MLFHDLHETLGRYHFQAHPNMTDAELESAQISRMWDLLASDEEYREAKEWVGGFTNQLDQTRPIRRVNICHLLGRELAEIASEDGVLTSAYKGARANLLSRQSPIVAFAVGIAGARFEKKNIFHVRHHPGCARHDECDGARAYLRNHQSRAAALRRVSFNRRTLSSFLQKEHHHGHKYAIQISTDAPHPVEDRMRVSFDEGLVYGKLARGAHSASTFTCDATIALPILITVAFANRSEVR